MERRATMNSQSLASLKQWAEEIIKKKEEIALLEKEISQKQEKVFETLEKNELETIVVGESESEIKITIVRPSTLKFKEDALQEQLSAKQWRQITKTVIDKKAVEDAVARGIVDISVISKNSSEVASKPYLKITNAKK